uniref:G_PROTEIN_RECEP_F1_2 domain-containing protein n=1 Tax=Steinernema glaseri TaxID=37863 RepID=A0A1I7YXS3_9BILA
MNSVQKVCAEAEKLSSDPLVLSFLMLRSFFSLVSVVMMVGLMFIERFTKRYHPNATILLRGYLFFTIASAMSTLFTDGVDTFRFLLYRPNNQECRIHLYAGKTAELMIMPTVFCVNALGIMFIFIGVERSIATVYASTYEKMKSTVPGWLLLLVATLVSFAKVVWFLSYSEVDKFNPMSTLGDIPVLIQQTSLGMQLALELLNVVVFSTLYCCNRRYITRKSLIVSSLTYKYQLNENVNSIGLLLQLAWFHCIVSILATSLIIFSVATFSEEEHLRYDLPIDLYPLYHCVFPFVMGYKVLQERRTQRRLKAVGVKERSQYRNQDGHFRMLEDLFEKVDN